MGHYYAKHMYESIYPTAVLTPCLASVTDESARLSIYMVNELFRGTKGRLACSFLSLNSFTPRAPVAYDMRSPFWYFLLDKMARGHRS